MAKLASKIPFRTLGKTNLQVSSVSLGCSPFGDVFGKLSFQECRNIAKKSFENGVNYFDTSPYYGELRSEQVLGNVLNSLSGNSSNNFYDKNVKEKHENDDYFCMDRKDFILSTKVGRYGVNTFDFSSNKVETSIESSLERLQTDYIDIAFVHDIEFATNLEQIWQETLPALEYLKSKNKIRKIGISGRPLIVLDYVMKQYGFDKIDCILTYNNYILFDTNLLQFINKWKYKYNIGLVQGGFTGLGLLTSNAQPPAWNNAPKEFKIACKQAVDLIPHLYKKFDNIKHKNNVNTNKKSQFENIFTNTNNINTNTKSYNENRFDLARLAFIFTYCMPLIDTTLIGMTNIQQIEKSIDWIKQSWNGINEIDEMVINELQKTVFADIMNRGWFDDTMTDNICKATKNYWK